jgi:hypothetical protein
MAPQRRQRKGVATTPKQPTSDEALFEAYVAGFKLSREGFNGEHPPMTEKALRARLRRSFRERAADILDQDLDVEILPVEVLDTSLNDQRKRNTIIIEKTQRDVERDLAESTRAVQRATAALEEATAERDDQIRSAILAHLPYARIAAVTGLSEGRLYQVRRGTRT